MKLLDSACKWEDKTTEENHKREERKVVVSTALAGGEGFDTGKLLFLLLTSSLLQYRAATGKGNYNKLLSSSQARFTKIVVPSLLAVFLSMDDNRYNF